MQNKEVKVTPIAKVIEVKNAVAGHYGDREQGTFTAMNISKMYDFQKVRSIRLVNKPVESH